MTHIHWMCAILRVHIMTVGNSVLGVCGLQGFEAQHHDVHP